MKSNIEMDKKAVVQRYQELDQVWLKSLKKTFGKI